MEPWEVAVAVAQRQYMLIATWQAEAAGVHRSVIAARVKHQGWRRYFWGVTGWPGPDSRHRQLAAAVLACARPTAAAQRVVLDDESPESLQKGIVCAALEAGHAVSARSAAWLHGFSSAPSSHSLWLPAASGRVKRDGVDLRYGGRPAGEITMVHDLPTLDPEGAILETARSPIGTFAQREDELIWQMSRADSLRKATVDSVEARALDLRQFSGCAVLRSALGKAKGKMSHSRVEHRGRALVEEALAPLGLHVERRPHAVCVDGQPVGEADIAVLAIMLDIEVDGPHHRFAHQQRKDQERDRHLRRLGWVVERFPDEFVQSRPKVFVAQVHAIAEARVEQLHSAAAPA